MSAVRRFVLAPLLAAAATLLVALAAVSFAAAIEEDLTALLYGAGLLALAAVAGAIATGLFTGRLPVPPAPPWAKRILAFALALVALWGGLLAALFSVWIFAVYARVDPEYSGDSISTGEQVAGVAVSILTASGAVGLLILCALLALFALTGRAGRPRAVAQSLTATGVLVAAAFLNWLVLSSALYGDYP